ncbi:MAG: ATP-binding protein, partial [Acidimicrobiia bacterium]|nr:ATP-binding protein [Acidimicrobiia bacterium]
DERGHRQRREQYDGGAAGPRGDLLAEQSQAGRRIHDAGFPRTKRLEDFDHTANDNVDPATIATLATGTWVSSGAPVCLIGDSGTGKSHLLIGLGIAAAEAGHRVRYVLASRLVNELAEADNDRTLSKVIARYGRVDLLCLDELGCAPRGAEEPCGRRSPPLAIAVAG